MRDHNFRFAGRGVAGFNQRRRGHLGGGTRARVGCKPGRHDQRSLLPNHRRAESKQDLSAAELLQAGFSRSTTSAGAGRVFTAITGLQWNAMKAFAALCLLLSPCWAQTRDYPVKPVPFTAVHVNDGFWAPRIEINRKVTIPFAFQKDEETGRVDNFIRAAKELRGEPSENHKYPPYPVH